MGCEGALVPLGVHWRWQVDWDPDHIGPQSRVPALPLVPLEGVTYLTKARKGPLSRVLSLPLASLGESPTWPRPSN